MTEESDYSSYDWNQKRQRQIHTLRPSGYSQMLFLLFPHFLHFFVERSFPGVHFDQPYTVDNLCHQMDLSNYYPQKIIKKWLSSELLATLHGWSNRFLRQSSFLPVHQSPSRFAVWVSPKSSKGSPVKTVSTISSVDDRIAQFFRKRNSPRVSVATS